MKTGPAREFCNEDADGVRTDAALHGTLLADSEGSARADMLAVEQGVARGLTYEEAARFYAGGAARMLLRRAGLL